MSTVNLNNADAIYFGDRQVGRVYLGAQRVWPPLTLTERVRALFDSADQGGMWDFTNPHGLFQDAAGTVPVESPGDPIGMTTDLSGNGNHLLQTTVPARPTYTEDGALHDGVDDFLAAEDAADWTFLHDGSGGALAVSLMVTDEEGSVGNKMVGTRNSGEGLRVGASNTATLPLLVDVRDANGDVISATGSSSGRGMWVRYVGESGGGGIRAYSNFGDTPLAPVTAWSQQEPQYPLRTLISPPGRSVSIRRIIAISRVLSDPERALVNAWLMEGVE